MISRIINYTRVFFKRLRYPLLSRKRKTIKILNAWETVDYIIKHKCSVSRYGDGEMNMIFNYEDCNGARKSGFQNFDPSLGRRLREILQEGGSEIHNHKVSLPGTMFSVGTGYLIRPAKLFWQIYTVSNLSRTISLLDKSKVFLETNFSRFYLSHKDKSRCREFINHVKGIWKDRDVILVEGRNTCLGVGNDLFEGAKSVKRILCPPTNAWSRYNDILHKTEDFAAKNRDSVIISALGMTATVLSRDLAHKGYQAIDLGHIDIEYEWMLRGATSKIAIPGKFTNEAKGGKEVENIKDAKYTSEIIAQID